MKFAPGAARSLPEAARFERRWCVGTFLLKYYLDISRKEQARRLRERRKDPLKQWKISPVDDAAQQHWRDYSRARDSMLLRTHHEEAPWIVVRADDKPQVRLYVILDRLSCIPTGKQAARHARQSRRARVPRKPHRQRMAGTPVFKNLIPT
jgi:polyphosphate kinase 2 (PPK2 family)